MAIARNQYPGAFLCIGDIDQKSMICSMIRALSVQLRLDGTHARQAFTDDDDGGDDDYGGGDVDDDSIS